MRLRKTPARGCTLAGQQEAGSSSSSTDVAVTQQPKASPKRFTGVLTGKIPVAVAHERRKDGRPEVFFRLPHKSLAKFLESPQRVETMILDLRPEEDFQKAALSNAKHAPRTNGKWPTIGKEMRKKGLHILVVDSGEMGNDGAEVSALIGQSFLGVRKKALDEAFLHPASSGAFNSAAGPVSSRSASGRSSPTRRTKRRKLVLSPGGGSNHRKTRGNVGGGDINRRRRSKDELSSDYENSSSASERSRSSPEDAESGEESSSTDSDSEWRLHKKTNPGTNANGKTSSLRRSSRVAANSGSPSGVQQHQRHVFGEAAEAFGLGLSPRSSTTSVQASDKVELSEKEEKKVLESLCPNVYCLEGGLDSFFRAYPEFACRPDGAAMDTRVLLHYKASFAGGPASPRGRSPQTAKTPESGSPVPPPKRRGRPPKKKLPTAPEKDALHNTNPSAADTGINGSATSNLSEIERARFSTKVDPLMVKIDQLTGPLHPDSVLYHMICHQMSVSFDAAIRDLPADLLYDPFEVSKEVEKLQRNGNMAGRGMRGLRGAYATGGRRSTGNYGDQAWGPTTGGGGGSHHLQQPLVHGGGGIPAHPHSNGHPGSMIGGTPSRSSRDNPSLVAGPSNLVDSPTGPRPRGAPTGGVDVPALALQRSGLRNDGSPTSSGAAAAALGGKPPPSLMECLARTGKDASSLDRPTGAGPSGRRFPVADSGVRYTVFCAFEFPRDLLEEENASKKFPELVGTLVLKHTVRGGAHAAALPPQSSREKQWALVKYVGSTKRGVGFLLQKACWRYCKHTLHLRAVYAGAWLEYAESWRAHYNWGYDYTKSDEWPRGLVFCYANGILPMSRKLLDSE